jgi:hypothetical protein
MSSLTGSVVFQYSFKSGFRYFKVLPIKAFRDIRHVSVDKAFASGREISRQVIQMRL